MKVRATTSFAGAEISMFPGEVRDVPEDVATPLLGCGYLVLEDAPDSTGDVGQTPESVEGYLDLADLKKMKRPELNALAEKMGIEDAAEYASIPVLAEAISKIPVEVDDDGGNEE